MRFLVKGVIVGMVMGYMVGVGWGANDDNRPIGTIGVRSIKAQAEDSMVIRFSTTIPANTDVQLLPDHFVYYGASMAWPSGITYSTTPAKNNGGRLWVGFQVVEGATGGAVYDDPQKVHWAFSTTVSTNTDPFVRAGGWFPPMDWPFVYQGTVTVRSTATAKISGVIITEKGR